MTAPPLRRWPDRLWIVRHGQSAGNVARDAADAAGLAVIDIAERDVDVPLSALGERPGRRPRPLVRGDARRRAADTLVLASPYVRARQTAAAVREAGGVHADARERARRAAAREGVRHPRPAHARRHRGALPRPGRGAHARRQVLSPAAGRRELVRRHPAAAQRARHREPAPRAPGARVLDRRAPGGRALHALPDRGDDRGGDPRDRPRGDVANCGVTEYALDATAVAPDARETRLRLRDATTSSRRWRRPGAPVTARPDAPGGAAVTPAARRPARAVRRRAPELLRRLPLPALDARRRQGEPRPRARGRRQHAGAGRDPARRRRGAARRAPASCSSRPCATPRSRSASRCRRRSSSRCPQTARRRDRRRRAARPLRDARERRDAVLDRPRDVRRPRHARAARRARRRCSATRPTLVLDGAAIIALARRPDAAGPLDGRAVLTPHAGEMASLLGIDKGEVEADPRAIARRRRGAVRRDGGAQGRGELDRRPRGPALSLRRRRGGAGHVGVGRHARGHRRRTRGARRDRRPRPPHGACGRTAPRAARSGAGSARSGSSRASCSPRSRGWWAAVRRVR